MLFQLFFYFLSTEFSLLFSYISLSLVSCQDVSSPICCVIQCLPCRSCLFHGSQVVCSSPSCSRSLVFPCSLCFAVSLISPSLESAFGFGSFYFVSSCFALINGSPFVKSDFCLQRLRLGPLKKTQGVPP